MKKCSVQVLACLAAILTGIVSFAEKATEADARMVARGWSMLNGGTFGSLGSVKEVWAEKDDQGQVLWYVVVMTGGAAVVAPDTEIEPVLAVMPGSDGVIPKGSALDAMLRRDIANRLAPLRQPALKLKSSAVQAALQSPAASKASGKWDKLRRQSTLKMLNADGSPATIVRWLDGWNSPNKVGNVQTLRFWNQNGSPYFSNKYVFDLYTPDHDPCGCVATAGSAIMHYFRAPSGATVTRTCFRSGGAVSLTTKGGIYDWSLIDGLNLSENDVVTLSDAAVDLLGRVASDCGIGCEMSYAKGGSGSNTCKLQWSFRNVFKVRHAQLVTKDGGAYGGGAAADIGFENYPKIVYNQIRGGAPLSFGIDGHEVVACGYGFDADKTDYTYIFLGWGGANDAWYALPNIDPKATGGGGWYTSTFIDELITEISFDDKFVAICGQLIDIDGNPVSGVNEDGTPNEDAVLTTSGGDRVWPDKNGYWGVRVNPSDPMYIEDSTGVQHEYVIGEQAKVTTDSGVAAAALAAALPEPMLVQLLNPSVQVYDGDTFVSEHGSVNSAVRVARGCSEARLVVTDRSVLQSSCTIDFDCQIVATNANPWASAVTCSKGARLAVDGGAAVLFTNVVFKAKRSGDTQIDVHDGSLLRLAGAFGLERIQTADYTCLELVTPITNAVEVNCLGAPDVIAPSNRVAWSKLPKAELESSARHLLCATDDERGGLAMDATGILAEPTVIVWQDGAPVPDVAAKAVLIQGDADPVNFRTFAALLKHYDPNKKVDCTIRVSGDCALNAQVPVRSGKTLTFFGSSNTVSVSGLAGFEIVSESKMVVSNVTFGGAIESSLFAVGKPGSTGSTGELVFGEGAVAANISSRSEFGGGVVTVYGGRLAMEAGSRMVNCCAGSGKANGGAVLLGSRTTLDLMGGTITSCYAAGYGGGVYVAAPATVNLSGASAVCGNVSSEKLTADDIYFANTEKTASAINLTGRLTGENGPVGIRFGTTNGFGEEGQAFATNGIAVSEAEASAPFFLNDAKPDVLVAAVSESGSQLVWAANPLGPGGCEPELAVVRVVYPTGDTNYYAQVETAFANLAGDCALELLTNCTFVGTLPVSCAITLRSVPEKGEVFELVRDGLEGGRIVVQAGAALTVEDLIVNGNFDEDTVGLGNLVEVNGGELVLKSGATLGNVTGISGRADGVITVWNGGHLTMESGSCVTNGWNIWEDAPTGVNAGVGGGILIDGEKSSADFRGGTVMDCVAIRGGGIVLANKSRAFVSGDFTTVDNGVVVGIDGNTVQLEANNLVVEDLATLALVGDFTGSVGVSEGIEADTNVFGKVDASYYAAADFAALTNGAARFSHDVRGVRGVVATNGTDTALLVWADAFVDVGGVLTFVDRDGNVYGVLSELPPPVPPPEPPGWIVVTNSPTPIAFKSIDRVSDTVWMLVITSRVPFCNYRLLSTDDLKKGFTTTGAWEQAVGPAADPVWTTNVITTGGAWFWRAEGTEGTNMVPPKMAK